MTRDNYCRSEYNGNRCEDADGHVGPHSHWIEGYGDLTWTDEQAEAEHQKTVGYWAERGVAWPPREDPAPELTLPAAEAVQRLEDAIYRWIQGGGTHWQGVASVKQDLTRAVMAREVALEAARIFQGGYAEDERDDPCRHFWSIFKTAFPGVDIHSLPPRAPTPPSSL